jgi:hypothetical protein
MLETIYGLLWALFWVKVAMKKARKDLELCFYKSINKIKKRL